MSGWLWPSYYDDYDDDDTGGDICGRNGGGDVGVSHPALDP